MNKLFLGFLILFLGFWHGGFSQSSVEEGEEYLEKGELKKAKNVLLEYESDERARELLGDLFCYQKEWDKAINYYESLAKDYPESPIYHFKYGGALGMQALKASKFKAALVLGDIKKSLRKAAELDSGYAEPRRALVELYVELPTLVGGSRETAEEFVHELDKINSIDAQVAREFIFKKEEDTRQAKAAARKALLEAKRNPDLISRNFLRYELGEFSARYETNLQTGAKLLQDYIKNHNYKDLEPPSLAYYHLARIYRARNNKEAALENINKALRLKVSFPEAEKEKRNILQL